MWLRGACVVAGGMHGYRGGVWLQGGMHGCWGHAWLRGCVHGCGGVPRRDDEIDEIRSMSGRYASYWNAFLLVVFSVQAFLYVKFYQMNHESENEEEGSKGSN